MVVVLPSARDAKTGKVLISETALSYLLPPQLKPMPERHKLICGCETYMFSAGPHAVNPQRMA
eukprot:7389915-Prymnesium_polylepis.1